MTSCLIVFVDTIGIGIILPILPFIGMKYSADTTRLSIIIVAFPMAQLVFSPILGTISDIFGRKNAIMGALVVAAFGYVLFWRSDSYWELIFSRILCGVGGATFAVAQALVADATANRTAAFGWLGAAYGAGLTLGPVFGAAFTQDALTSPGLIGAMLCVGNVITIWFALPNNSLRSPVNPEDPLNNSEDPRKSEQKRISSELWPHVSLVTTIYTFSAGAFEGIIGILTIFFLWKLAITTTDAAIIWSVAGMSTIVARAGALGPLSRALGDLKLVFIGITGLAVSTALIPSIGAFWSAIAAIVVFSIGASFVFPCLASMLLSSAPSGRRGSLLGIMHFVGGIGKVLGPIAAAAIYDGFGPAVPFYVAAACFLCSLFLSGFLRLSRGQISSQAI